MVAGLCVTVLVDKLIQKGMMLDAVDYIYAYDFVGKFLPVQLLKDYLDLNKQKIHIQGDKLSLQKVRVSYIFYYYYFPFLVLHICNTKLLRFIDQAADKEIAVIRTIIRYISKYRLESKFPPEELEKQISELEKMKRAKVNQSNYVPIARASTGESIKILIE